MLSYVYLSANILNLHYYNPGRWEAENKIAFKKSKLYF